MEALRPIFWGQGMFLHPQHFQQQDWYHDARLRESLHFLVPFCWGVKSLIINTERLQNFLFDVRQCEVITWDGTILRFRSEGSQGNARLTQRSFENDLDKTGKPLSVYLGLRRIQREDRHVSTSARSTTTVANGRSDHRRFLMEEVETPDFWADDQHSTTVQYLTHNLQILFDVPASRTHDYELVKLAEIRRAPDGRGGELVTNYVPPSISIRSSEELWTMIDKISQRVQAKGEELRRFEMQQSAELSSGDMRFLAMRQTLNRYTPLFHHYMNLGDVHPATVYAALCQLVGELSTFSDSVSALGASEEDDSLPPYNHEQLWWCFHLATTRATELLDQLTASPVGDIRLEYDGKEYFIANLDPDLFASDNRFYLAIGSDVPPDELYRLLQRTGKITAVQEMLKIRDYALFGVKIDVLQTPPEELRFRAHYRYFQIDRNSANKDEAEHWRKVQQHKNIAVWSREPTLLPSNTDIRLVIVYGKQDQARRRVGR